MTSINLLFGIILLWSILSTSLLVLHHDLGGDGAGLSRLSPENLNKSGSSLNVIRGRVQKDGQTATKHQSKLQTPTRTNSTPEPVWKEAKTEADAAYLLSQGTWLHGSYHVPENSGEKESQSYFLNSEELNFLKWSKAVTSKMTVETATTRVAFKVWGDNPFASLYGTATSLSQVTNSEFFCRLSWGYHWCDPVNHDIVYHSKHWSNARGVELLEIFVRLANTGRDSPSILFMGDSVISETWQAGICSLARAKVEFLPMCPDTIVHPFPNVTSVCFNHEQLNGMIGVIGVLADQGFDKQTWRNAVFGGANDSKNRTVDETKGIGNFNWDLVLPNLGVHHNLGTLNEGDYDYEYARYREYLTSLFEILLDHSETNTQFPTLNLFWGSSPQHFRGSLDGLFDFNSGNEGCTAIYPSLEAHLSNRRRSAIVWEVMFQELSKRKPEASCKQEFSIPNNPSYEETNAILNNPCINKMLNTCNGGISHLEVEQFLLDRPDVHPGTRCVYTWSSKHQDDPDGKNCDPNKHTKTDCTHHCWGPLLYQPIWERLEIAVAYHLERCQGL